jgi:hypothetical protein
MTIFSEIPKIYINGTENNGNPIFLRRIKERYRNIEQETSPIDFEFEMSMKDSVYTMKVNIKSSQTIGTKKLHFYLMNYYYSRYELPANSVPNGESQFYWIPRKAFTGTSGISIDLKNGTDISHTFEHKIDQTHKNGNLYLVAFIQDEQTGEVLQAGTNFNIYPCEIKTEQAKYNLIKKGETITFPITLENPTGYDIEYDLSAKANNANWTVKFDEPVAYIFAGDSETINVSITANNNCTYSPIEISAYPQMYYMKHYYGVRAKSTLLIHFLTKETDMLTLTLGDLALNKISEIQEGIDNYQSRWAIMDYDVFDKGFSNNDFDFLYLALPSSYSDLWHTDNKLPLLATKYLQENKNLLLTIPNGLYNTSISKNNETLNHLYSDILNIEYSHKYDSFSETGDGIDDFQIETNAVVGFSSHDEGYRYDFSELNTDYNLFFKNLETIDIKGENTEKLLIYCDTPDDQEGLTAGVYTEYNGSKCVYLTYGLECSDNMDSIRTHLSAVLDKMGYSKRESIFKLENTELVFFSYIDSIKTKKFIIKNTGNTSFSVSEIKIEGSGAEVFDYHPKLNNALINPNEEREVSVSFYPYSDSYFEAEMKIITNADIYPIRKVYLYGYGETLSIVDKLGPDVRIFPNPASKLANIKFNLKRPTHLNIELIDYSGRKLIDIHNGFANVGEKEFNFEISHLTAGKYFIRFSDKYGISVYPIVIGI